MIGHEVAHIANGDMVTDDADPGRDEHLRRVPLARDRLCGRQLPAPAAATAPRSPGIGYYVSTIVLDIVLGFAAAMVVAWFSRQREFRADAGSAALMGQTSQPMVNALARWAACRRASLPKAVEAMGITGSIGKLFSRTRRSKSASRRCKNAR